MSWQEDDPLGNGALCLSTHKHNSKSGTDKRGHCVSVKYTNHSFYSQLHNIYETHNVHIVLVRVSEMCQSCQT
jgi:hypothetical protein